MNDTETTLKRGPSNSISALPPEMAESLRGLGFERLTPIQALTLPLLRAGKDVVGQSDTGSGKTIAFGLPLLERTDTSGRVIQALIICPTRELCEQVARSIRKIGRLKKDLLVVTLVGGQPIFTQLKSLRHGVHIVVGTPGRLQDLIEKRKLDLRSVHTVVLDEADRMLDMGFKLAMEAILECTPKTRQTAFFSATFPPTIDEMSRQYQNDPVHVKVESRPEDKPKIEQVAYQVSPTNRIQTLVQLLKESDFESALIFCNFKLSVDELTDALNGAKLRADKIHGDMNQGDRDRAIVRFRNGTSRLLVATDVAARGIDIEGLDAVINFELTRDPLVHVHRIGRTGRAGKSGLAISLWSENEEYVMSRIEKNLGMTLERKAYKLSDAPVEIRRPEWETIEISGGRKDKVRAGDILGALTGECGGLPGTSIGKIEIQDRISFVAVERSVSFIALKNLQRGKIKGRRFVANMVNPQAHRPGRDL